jgi:type I restriction enzyme, S subunit
VKAGWKTNTLEDCLERFRVPAKIQRKQFREAGAFPIVSQEADFVNGYWDKAEDVCVLDRPVVIFGDHTQVLKYVDFDFVVGADGVKVLAPKPFIDAKYLYYFVMANRAPSLGYARHYRHVKELAVSYPDPEEQQRIVAVLDEAFEGLARARAHAEANLQNARELFGSELASVCNTNAEEYGTVSLVEISEEITDGDHMPPPKAQEGVPFVTIKNIDKETHCIDFSDTFKVPESYYQELKDKRKPRLGDVLYTVTGSFGIPVLVQAEQRFCFQRHIGLIRPRRDVSPEWLYFVLASPFVFEQADAGATGTAQRTVSLKLLRSMVVPSVPSKLQAAMAERFQDISAEASRLTVSYQAKLKDLEDLRQSFLQKAFAGDLT